MLTNRIDEFFDNDVFIASYPRSGNTWLRLLLTDIILQNAGFPSSTKLPIHQDRVIPNVDDFQSFETDSRVDIASRLLKTHAEFHSLMNRVVFVLRRPDDCLCSYYHYHLRYENMQEFASQGVDNFCRRKVKPWIRHTSGYLKAVQNSFSDIFVTSYEQLHTDTIRVLLRLTEWLEIPCTLQQLRAAIGSHAFQNHHRIAEPKGQFGERFYRKGIVGSAESELSTATLRFINRKAMHIYDHALAWMTVPSVNCCQFSYATHATPIPSS